MTTHVVIQEQNRKIPNNNNNQAAQVQGTYDSKIGASLNDDNNAFKETGIMDQDAEATSIDIKSIDLCAMLEENM